MIHIEICHRYRLSVETLEAVDNRINRERDISKRQQANGRLRIRIGRSRKMQGLGFGDCCSSNKGIKVGMRAIKDSKRDT